MAALKCESCYAWSIEEGCKLERKNYYRFRDCMTGKKDYWHAKRRKENVQEKRGRSE